MCWAQGGASLSAQARGWSLLHLAACLENPAALTFMLSWGSLPVNGAPAASIQWCSQHCRG